MSLLLAVAAGGNVTVTPPTATLTLTGFAPSVLTPRLVTPGVRALVLTGIAPSVATPRKVTPANAALVLTGFAAAVQTPRKVTPAVRALTLTGFAPTIATPIKIAPAVRGLVLTGYAPVVTVPLPALVITPAAAQLVLLGYAPNVQGDLHQGGFGYVVADTRRNLRYEFPEAEMPEPVLISPAPLRLKLTTFAPTIVKGSSVAFGLDELEALASELDPDELAVLIAA